MPDAQRGPGVQAPAGDAEQDRQHQGFQVGLADKPRLDALQRPRPRA